MSHKTLPSKLTGLPPVDFVPRDAWGYAVLQVGARRARYSALRGNNFLDPRDFGAKFDGVTDDFQALRDTLDEARTSKVNRIVLPPGAAYVSQELEIDSQVYIDGAHGINVAYNTAGTTLLFPKDVNGIRVCRADTSTSGGLGDDSVLANFDVRCIDPTTKSGSGILMDARAKLVNLRAAGFGLDGCTIVSTGGLNANLWSIERCAFGGNRRDGFYVDGADVNAGYAVGLNTTSNGRNGIYDSSFLGNAYLGAHSATNGRGYWVRGSDGQAYACIQDHYSTADTLPVTGADWETYWELAAETTSYPAAAVNRQYYADGGRNYKSDGSNARNLFSGCYSEPGAPRKDYIAYPAQIIGGHMMSDVEGAPLFSGVKGMEAITVKDGVTVTSRFGNRTDARLDAFGFSSDDQSTGWHLYYNATAKTWDLRPTNADTNRSFRLIDNGGDTGLPTGLLDFATLGFGLGGKRHFFGIAAPTTGTWAHGDIVFNTAPSAGGFMGWTCTSAGMPGTWKGFGAIEA